MSNSKEYKKGLGSAKVEGKSVKLSATGQMVKNMIHIEVTAVVQPEYECFSTQFEYISNTEDAIKTRTEEAVRIVLDKVKEAHKPEWVGHMESAGKQEVIRQNEDE